MVSGGMQVVSVNVSMPVEAMHEGKKVSTGIFKSPVQGTIAVTKLNLGGDGQADLTVHGGVDKAVYAYSLDHYAYWERVLGRSPLPRGQFGENLTIAGLDEAVSCVGDHLQIGSAVFAITQPRQPCFKLGIRFGDMEMPKLFTKSARTGFYLKVVREGSLTAGDEVRVVEQGKGRVSVQELFLAYFNPAAKESKEIYARAVAVPELSASWRRSISSRL
jgi:MOSC domain-containing protein YiiM